MGEGFGHAGARTGPTGICPWWGTAAMRPVVSDNGRRPPAVGDTWACNRTPTVRPIAVGEADDGTVGAPFPSVMAGTTIPDPDAAFVTIWMTCAPSALTGAGMTEATVGATTGATPLSVLVTDVVTGVTSAATGAGAGVPTTGMELTGTTGTGGEAAPAGCASNVIRAKPANIPTAPAPSRNADRRPLGSRRAR